VNFIRTRRRGSKFLESSTEFIKTEKRNGGGLERRAIEERNGVVDFRRATRRRRRGGEDGTKEVGEVGESFGVGSRRSVVPIFDVEETWSGRRGGFRNKTC
jgi:hypothetical protein